MKTIVVRGKSKLADKLFIYDPLFFCMEHPEIKTKVLYFTLEMSASEKFLEFQSHLLFKLDGITISPTDLTSTDSSKPVPMEILEKLRSERYQRYTRKFEETVTFIDDIKNPTGKQDWVCKNISILQKNLYLCKKRKTKRLLVFIK